MITLKTIRFVNLGEVVDSCFGEKAGEFWDTFTTHVDESFGDANYTLVDKEKVVDKIEDEVFCNNFEEE